MKCIHIRRYIGSQDCGFTEEYGRLLHYWLNSRGSRDGNRKLICKHKNNHALVVL